MSTMVPMYGFGGGGGTGAALTVTAPAGCTVTVSKDVKTKTKVAGTDGVAVFKGLATGDWTLSITDGEQTAQKTVTITADYSAAITFFAATIHVTYPAGSTCTATGGVTTLTAPDTSGTWDCVVPNAGTWTVSLDNGLYDHITVTKANETYTLNKWHLYNAGSVVGTEFSGGVSSDGYTWGGGTASLKKAVFNADHILMEAIAGQYASAFGTNNKVNLTGFADVCVVLECNRSGGSQCGIAIATAKEGIRSMNGCIGYTDINTTTGIEAVRYPINGYSGDCYIVCSLDGTSNAKIHEILLEV